MTVDCILLRSLDTLELALGSLGKPKANFRPIQRSAAGRWFDICSSELCS